MMGGKNDLFLLVLPACLVDRFTFFFLVKSKIEEPEMMMSILLPSAWTPSRAGVIYQPTCHCCVGESHPTGKWKFRFVM